jgi:type IV pilus assembly protein PilB
MTSPTVDPRRLGDILISLGLLDEVQLRSALSLHRYWGKPLGWAVVHRRFCTEQQVLGALEIQTGIKGMDLDCAQLDPQLAALIPAKVAQKHRLVPVALTAHRKDVLVVAVAAPGSLTALDEAQKVARKHGVEAVLATDSAIERAIARLYLPDLRGAAYLPGVMKPATDAAQDPGAFTGEQQEARPVLIYGWAPTAAKTLAITLASEWVQARVAGPSEVLQATARDIVLAPLAALEALRPAAGYRAKLVVACDDTVFQLSRAQRLGACRVLPIPPTCQQLIDAVMTLGVVPMA